MSADRALITHNVASLRAEPNSDAERISQAIMGDAVTLLESQDDYVRVRMPDAYEGWVLQRHLRPFEEIRALAAELKDATEPTVVRVMAPIADFIPLDSHYPRTKLVFGTPLMRVQSPRGTPQLGRVFAPDGQQGFVDAKVLADPRRLLALCDVSAAACAFARQFLGTPYLWGGTTSFGFDCSGFTQRLYSVCDVILPRDAYQQAESPLGVKISSGEPLKAGDLVFFGGDNDPRGRGVTHVGMALGEGNFIHAAGKDGVTITALDEPRFARVYLHAWRFQPPAPNRQ